MTLSIIIPTLNEEKYLPLLLKSIKKQTLKPLEIILADARSKDETIKIGREFGCKIIKGGNPGFGRNNGAKIAKGEMLLFLDADVILPKRTFLEDSVNEIKERRLDVTSCYLKPRSHLKVYELLFDLANQYLRINQTVNPKAMGYIIFVKKAVHRKLKGFDSSILLGEDFDYIKRSAKVGRFALLESHKILVSIRRFEKEGRFKLITKYIISELHQMVAGPIRKKIYNYKFGEFENLHKHET